MASRLPTPGADDGTWGDILNDFLAQAHNPDGSLKPLAETQVTNLTNDLANKANASALATKLDTATATATYAPLPKTGRNPLTGWHHVTGYGALGNGASSAAVDTAAFQAAIAAAALDNAPIYVQRPPVAYQITATLQTFPNMYMFGDAPGRASEGGTEIRCAVVGPLFQMGSDDGHAYDLAEYDGPEGLTLRNLYLKGYTTTSTLGFDGSSVYCPGTYGVRDWRGGDVKMDNVYFEGFEWWFWGIQSDLNTFRNVEVRHCKRGFYLGPRSDQNTFYDLYSTLNDKIGTIDCASQAVFFAPKFVGNGTATTNGLTITNVSSTTVQTNGVYIEDPWFEHLQGTSNIEAFIEMGVGDTVQVKGLVVRNPLIGNNPQATTPHAQYFLKTDNADQIEIEITDAVNISNLNQLLLNIGTFAPGIFLRNRVNGLRLRCTNTGSGVCDPMLFGEYSSLVSLTRNSSGQPVLRAGLVADTQTRFEINSTAQLRFGSGAAAVDLQVQRVAAGVLGIGTGIGFRSGVYTTASRPSAVTAGAGTSIYDSTLSKPIWSDGTVWRDAAGTAV
ncbi:MAG: hypothetical protein JWN38_1079 [Candidatus Saccharibacteria bacterium]|nr:hypothetical protein [Candidatus Saccharibacteria bacterium]